MAGKHDHLVLILFILVIITRFIPIGNIYSEDEMILPFIAESGQGHYIHSTMHRHPFLGELIFGTYGSIFGVSLTSMRLLPILISIINVVMIYVIARRFYSKKIARLSLFLSLVSFHMLVTSPLISIDQSVVFLSLVFIYLVLKESKFKNMFVLTMGFLLGISMMLKYQMITLYPIIFLYMIYRLRLLRAIIAMTKISLLSILVFSVYPLFSYLTNPRYFIKTVEFLLYFTNNVPSCAVNECVSLPFGTSLLILLMWTTPLLIGLSFLGMKKMDNKDYLQALFIVITLLFNIFIAKRGDYSRYLMVMLAPLIILSAKYFSRIRLDRMRFIFLVSVSVLTFLFSHIYSILSLKNAVFGLQYVSFYLGLIKNLQFNFFYPMHFDHGYWLSINFALMMMIYALMGLTFILYFVVRGHAKTLFIIAFIGAGIGYNIYLDSEFLFHVSQPDPDSVIKEMISFYEQNNLQGLVYTTDKGFLYQMGKVDDEFQLSDGSQRINNLDILRSTIEQKGGTIMYLRFSPYYEEEDILNIPSCSLLKEFRSKDIPFGYVLSCEPSQRSYS